MQGEFRSSDHVRVVETIVEELVAKCFEDPKVEACRVAVLKPDIFNEAEGAGIDVYRTREGWTA